MAGFPSPFGGDDDALFDGYDEFVPEHLPDPGPFIEEQAVLAGEDHLDFHEITRELFEERTVYDMTFNYNLARLNFDTRHEGAGYRYAEETDASDLDGPDAGDRSVLRAEFTPTTPFCPQTHTLTIGSFRAWNGLAERHEYDLVRVRAAPMHHQSRAINEQLANLEAELVETGEVPDGDGSDGLGAMPADDSIDDDAVPGPSAPF
ncbi:hypothetical protein SAMN06269185_2015 [Natronoarchaeum philippinense]|uniref:DUF7998 domain-containing protein n=1 Tax=Natronoarchaeum philippinense TaxID=558529 RepID=A0A285NUV3_NATPI|nr:hypothetical protein [Natronoarchaeum philippinense]SNZ13018.1 hypothetical protein SAMN06269185_2015 [Natronoarchaeum philippinense]